MTRIVIVEDQALIRDAIATILSLDNLFEVVGKYENGQQALDALQQISDEATMPDIILSDIEMPVLSGIDLAEHIANRHPNITVVIMTTFAKAGYIKRAMSANVKGFILKEASSEYLMSSMQAICKGKTIIEPELAILALEDNDPLTTKERKALRLVYQGLSTQQVADSLFLSQGTVRNYLSEAISKLHAVNSHDAARIAMQKGWL